MPKYKLVEVRWQDSVVASLPWLDKGELRHLLEDQLSTITSVGFLLLKEKTRLVLLGDLSNDQVGRVLEIPRGCILEVKTLGVAESNFSFASAKKTS